MMQKVLRVGTSAAVTIPKKSLEHGDEELRAWTRRFIARYRPALKALAKR